MLEKPEFAVRAAAVDQRLKGPGEFLHRHLLPGDHVISRARREDRRKKLFIQMIVSFIMAEKNSGSTV